MKKTDSGRLLSEFAPHSYAEWKAAAEQLLKGRSFEKTLLTPTHEGFELEPIYTREVLEKLVHLGDAPGMGSRVRGSRVEGDLESGWLVSQELSAPTAEQLNGVLLKELENGQNELNLWLDKPTRRGVDADSANPEEIGVCGVSLGTVEDVRTLLKGVHPEMISLHLRSGAAAAGVYALLVATLREAGVDLAKVRGCLGMDPIGWLVETGEPGAEEGTLHQAMAGLLRHAALVMPGMQVIDVQGHAYHNGGGSSVQEMAAVLATAVAYLREMVGQGISPESISRRMRLSVSVGGNFFLEVGKLRALRMLWNRVLEAFEVPEAARTIHLHARTGLWNKTVFDPYVNMLRTTTEAFAAVVGGCDSLHVGPFDEVFRESDAFSRRIARNTHAILAEECGLSRVVDPAGGSWAVESLTDRMAAEAWKQFQQIEADGGILAVLRSGKLQEQVEATRQEKARNIQRRKEVLVGINNYPNAGEKLLPPAKIDYAAARKERMAALEAWKSGRDGGRVEALLARVRDAGSEPLIEALVEAAAAGATLGELHAAALTGNSTVRVEPVRLKRAAEDFEKLRFASMALAGAGTAPTVHQLNLGPSRRYRVRADWTSAFFQVAGLQVLNRDDYAGVEEALVALQSGGARVAIITSDDETYAELVVPMARAVKESDPGITVLVAGAPGEQEQAWRDAGVDDFVHVRVNNYTFNRALLESMGAQL